METVYVVGAGLAGSEAAWQLAERDINVELIEMKPGKKTPAHASDNFAELVCSNSLRSNELTNAVGLLKEEMRRLNSLIMRSADANRVEAGGALAVDRNGFAEYITSMLKNHPKIKCTSREVTNLPDGIVIVATGPLTSAPLARHIADVLKGDRFLSFYDAAAPIVTGESIDMNSAFYASRYDKGTADYINCPMDKEEYISFYKELITAEEAEVHGFDDSGVFEGCMPVEVMARRGEDTLRYGPLKPVGLKDPKTGREPYAVVQLRKDNSEGTLFNLVGFQTHLKIGKKKRVFSMIPALKNAEFVRYGVMHRNTYIQSPGILDSCYRLKQDPRIRFAGQMTGVEGYVESAASGLLVGIETALELHGKPTIDFTRITAIGALAHYISNETVSSFQPMNINFGIMQPLDYKVKGKRNKNLEISKRSLEFLDKILSEKI